MTTYSKTDNYALNLYGDTDPADLRDGYNGSMRAIDTTLETHLNRIEGSDSTLETHLNRIEGVESRETHDEEVVNALLGDNTVDAATTAKNKWDKASTDASAALTHTGENSDLLTALGADTVPKATIVYNSGMMDISKLGCKKDDPNFDNAPIINDYINRAHKAIYIPEGNWYIQTTLQTQGVSIYADGWVKAAPGNNFTGGTMVYALGSTELQNSSKMPKGRKIYINIDGAGYNIDGLTVQGFFSAEIKATVIACMATAVKTQGRNIECKFFLTLYGGLTSDPQYADCGLKVANGDNDNYAYVVGRNFRTGIDLNASIWTFQYLHIWGCDNVLKLYPETKNYVYMLYADYSYNGSVICDSTEQSAQLYCGDIFAILPKNQYFIGTPDGAMNYVRVVANSYKANLVQNTEGRKQGASYMKIKGDGREDVLITQSRIEDFGEGANLLVSEDDLNTKSLNELFDKYGPISFHNNLQEITFEKYSGFTTWEDFKTTQYYRNMTALGYSLPNSLTGSEGYHYGRTNLTVKKSHYTRKFASSPVAPYIVDVLLGNNIRGFYDSAGNFYTIALK